MLAPGFEIPGPQRASLSRRGPRRLKVAVAALVGLGCDVARYSPAPPMIFNGSNPNEAEPDRVPPLPLSSGQEVNLRSTIRSRQVALDIHRDVKQPSDGDVVGAAIHVQNQVVRPDAKDAERTLERPRAKRVSTHLLRRIAHVFQIALGNVAAPALGGITPQFL